MCCWHTLDLHCLCGALHAQVWASDSGVLGEGVWLSLPPAGQQRTPDHRESGWGREGEGGGGSMNLTTE